VDPTKTEHLKFFEEKFTLFAVRMCGLWIVDFVFQSSMKLRVWEHCSTFVNFRLGGYKKCYFLPVGKSVTFAQKPPVKIQKTHILIISNFHEQAKFVTVQTKIHIL
jgi:hypothetical protein